MDRVTLQKMQDAFGKTQDRVARNGEKMAQANTHLNTLNKDRISLLLVEMDHLPEHLVPVFRQVVMGSRTCACFSVPSLDMWVFVPG